MINFYLVIVTESNFFKLNKFNKYYKQINLIKMKN